MIKNCATCNFAEMERCPIMETAPDGECFAWVKNYEEWQKRLAECRSYRRKHESKYGKEV